MSFNAFDTVVFDSNPQHTDNFLVNESERGLFNLSFKHTIDTNTLGLTSKLVGNAIRNLGGLLPESQDNLLGLSPPDPILSQEQIKEQYGIEVEKPLSSSIAEYRYTIDQINKKHQKDVASLSDKSWTDFFSKLGGVIAGSVVDPVDIAVGTAAAATGIGALAYIPKLHKAVQSGSILARAGKSIGTIGLVEAGAAVGLEQYRVRGQEGRNLSGKEAAYAAIAGGVLGGGLAIAPIKSTYKVTKKRDLLDPSPVIDTLAKERLLNIQGAEAALKQKLLDRGIDFRYRHLDVVQETLDRLSALGVHNTEIEQIAKDLTKLDILKNEIPIENIFDHLGTRSYEIYRRRVEQTEIKALPPPKIEPVILYDNLEKLRQAAVDAEDTAIRIHKSKLVGSGIETIQSKHRKIGEAIFEDPKGFYEELYTQLDAVGVPIERITEQLLDIEPHKILKSKGAARLTIAENIYENHLKIESAENQAIYGEPLAKTPEAIREQNFKYETAFLNQDIKKFKKLQAEEIENAGVALFKHYRKQEPTGELIGDFFYQLDGLLPSHQIQAIQSSNIVEGIKRIDGVTEQLKVKLIELINSKADPKDVKEVIEDILLNTQFRDILQQRQKPETKFDSLLNPSKQTLEEFQQSRQVEVEYIRKQIDASKKLQKSLTKLREHFNDPGIDHVNTPLIGVIDNLTYDKISESLPARSQTKRITNLETKIDKKLSELIDIIPDKGDHKSKILTIVDSIEQYQKDLRTEVLKYLESRDKKDLKALVKPWDQHAKLYKEVDLTVAHNRQRFSKGLKTLKELVVTMYEDLSPQGLDTAHQQLNRLEAIFSLNFAHAKTNAAFNAYGRVFRQNFTNVRKNINSGTPEETFKYINEIETMLDELIKLKLYKAPKDTQ